MLNTKDNIPKTKDISINTKGIKKLRTRTKEKKLVKMILDNPNEPIKKHMMALGYSKSTSNTPSIVTNRPTFIELLEKAGLTDNRLAEVAEEGLKANKPIIDKGQITEEYPDHFARHKYLETVLKVKKHLNTDNNFNMQINDYKVIIEE